MKEFFKNYHKYVKSVKPLDKEDRDLLEMFFGKHKGITLTSWIKNFKDDGIDYNQSEISIKDIINKELSFFVQNNNLRCIPSLVDGLKLSQFKTLYGCIERDTNESILESIALGRLRWEPYWRFVGSNNINLLEPIGQFGTRYDLSKFENDKKSLDNQLIKFHQKSATDIWIEDLDALESELDSLLNNNIENEENTPSTNTKRKLSVYLKDNNQTNIMEEN
ncbi:11988_t:CDS:2, partial [Entrophospora sp. SA101]